jgi:hypothetical protein
VACTGDGSDGNRVQALYVVASDRADRSGEVVPLIRSWVADIDAIFSDSSAAFEEDYVVRWVHDEQCVVDVQTVVVPAVGDDAIFDTIHALAKAGYDQAGRQYLAWVDADVYCGIAVNYPDDSPGPDNLHNGDMPLWARVDSGCWGLDGFVEAHELAHMFGAVQWTAPHATPFGHCTDEGDLMCYVDGPGVQMQEVCADPAAERLLDCNHDDYFNPHPAQGSYLADHWNVAMSSFLHDRSVDDGPEARPTPPAANFSDVEESHLFAQEIAWLVESEITRGCNPPDNTRYCPEQPVTRGQMAAFLARGLALPAAEGDRFDDDGGNVFEADIERLARAGITAGCGDGRFCPDHTISRGQMAAFLARALSLPPAGRDHFADDDGSTFEGDINRLAEAGITTGCGDGRFCPDRPVDRGQMAAFLRRAIG